MREIKFRAWDKEYKKMMEWGKQLKGLTQNGIKTVMSYNGESGWSDCYNLKDIDLMQYTGLKDKNGVEIYEGDIIKGKEWEHGNSHRHIGVVTYIGNAFRSVGINKYLGFHGSVDGSYEVIGNIHENSDLFGGGTT